MKGSIPRTFIDDILTKINIVDLFNTSVKLKHAGREYQVNAISFLLEYDMLFFVVAV